MQARFASDLKSHGYSLTTPRRLVFAYLTEHGMATTKDLVTGLPQLDRASVYRTLHLLLELDVLREVGLGRGRRYELSDRFDDHHHHFVCSQCGRTDSFEAADLETVMQRLSLRQGFTLESHQVELTGRCSNCTKM